MKDGYILLLFVLGMFLVFTFSGALTGKIASVYTPSDQTTINKAVLSMFNKCSVYVGSSGIQTCSKICQSFNKICVSAEEYFLDNLKKGQTKMISCDYMIGGEIAEPHCLCCSA